MTPPVLAIHKFFTGLEAATAVSTVVSTASATAAQKQDDPDCLTAAISAKEGSVAISASAAAAQK